ncbi:MAG: pyruvate kinase alpha/beta domain-containing protein [Promethearchaeota archaeon]
MEFAYFEKTGKKNTEDALKLAKKNAEILKIKNIVIASTTGDTALKSLGFFDPKDYNIVVVSHNFGFKDNVPQEMSEEIMNKLSENGVRIVTGTLAYSGVESALKNEYNHYDFVALFSRLIRTLFCDGVKVCHEIVLMATDAGTIPIGEDVISIAGTGRGADTVCLIKSASSRSFHKARIKAILAKPL